MRKMILLAGACALLAACGQRAQQPVSVDDDGTAAYASSMGATEQEDCDADDLAEGDEDCYGVRLHGHKKHKTVKHQTYGSTYKPTTKPKSSYSYSSSKPSYGSSSSSSYSSSKPSYSSSRPSSRSYSSGRRR